MKYNQSNKREITIGFRYYSSTIEEGCYSCDSLSCICDFLTLHGISEKDLNSFISYVDRYKIREDTPLNSLISLTILGNKLIYAPNYLYIKEQIFSYQQNRELMGKDLVRIIECSKWSATFEKSYNYVDISYTCKGDELGLLIYVYKGYVVLCRKDGSSQYIYYCDNIRIIVDDSLVN